MAWIQGILFILGFCCYKVELSRSLSEFHGEVDLNYKTCLDIGIQFRPSEKRIITGHGIAKIAIEVQIPFIFEESFVLPEGIPLMPLDVNETTYMAINSHRDLQYTNFKKHWSSARVQLDQISQQLRLLYDWARQTNESVNVFLGEFDSSGISVKRKKRNILGTLISAMTGLVSQDEMNDIRRLVKRMHSANSNTQQGLYKVQTRLQEFVMIAESSFKKNHKAFSVIKETFETMRDGLLALFQFGEMTWKQLTLQAEYTRQLGAQILQYISISNMIQSQLKFMDVIRDLQLGKLSPEIVSPQDLEEQLSKIADKVAAYDMPKQLLFDSVWRYYLDSLVTNVIMDHKLYVVLALPIIDQESVFINYDTIIFDVPLDINNPIGYQRVRNIKDHFLVSPSKTSYIELTDIELRACHEGSIITCSTSFSRRTVGTAWTCASASFFGQHEKLLELCDIQVFPNLPIHPMSLPDTNGSYLLINTDDHYRLICDNILREIPSPVMLKVQIDCRCTLEFSDLLLYDTDRKCLPTWLVKYEVESEYFLIHQAISKIRLSAPIHRLEGIFKGSNSRDVINKQIAQLQDLNTQALTDGLSLKRLLECISSDSGKYYESSSLEFLVDIPHIKSSSFMLVYLVINIPVTIFCLCVAIWVVRKNALFGAMGTLFGRTRVVTAAAFAPLSPTPSLAPLLQVEIHFQTFTYILQYLVFLAGLIMLLYKIYQFMFLFRRHLPCKHLFTDSAKGTDLFMRIFSTKTCVEIFVGVVPFDLRHAVITVTPLPLAESDITFDNCNCTATYSIKWRNGLHYKLGNEFGRYDMPETYDLSWSKARKLAQVLNELHGTGLLNIHYLTRGDDKEFQMLTVFPELVLLHQNIDREVKRQFARIPPAASQTISAPPGCGPFSDTITRPEVGHMPSFPSFDAGLDSNFMAYRRDLAGSPANDSLASGLPAQAIPYGSMVHGNQELYPSIPSAPSLDFLPKVVQTAFTSLPGLALKTLADSQSVRSCISDTPSRVKAQAPPIPTTPPRPTLSDLDTPHQIETGARLKVPGNATTLDSP